MKFKSVIIAQASGSIGGTTFSRNRGGAYVRNRSVPTNPASPQQVAVRATVADLTSAWLDTLTDAQRRAWETYAANVPLVDPLGEPRNVGGIAMYVRSNVPREQAGLARVDDAPTVFNLGEFTAPSFGTISAGAGTAEVNFEVTDAWVNEDDAVMGVLLSRGQNASINFFKGPYRFAGGILGDAATPPTSPATITLPFPVAEAQKVFGQFRVMRVDGRTSDPFRVGGTVGS